MKIAVVGVTGLVGSVILKVLEEYNMTDCTLLPVASERSIGKNIVFNNRSYSVLSIKEALEAKPSIAIFSAGSNVSLSYAPLFAEKGTFVIDNSSAWRMKADIPLIVPEINASLLKSSNKIIANPNCSTIQLVMVLHPLHQLFTIKRVVVSTYQSVTGTGVLAVEQLMCERRQMKCQQVYPHPIDLNVLPHGGNFEENGYTSEEMKLVNETRKILSDNSIELTSTVVRVPVKGGHSESVNIEFEEYFNLTDIYSALEKTPGICIIDNPYENQYPMPLYAEGKNEVFVGRVRRDFSRENSLNLWIVADNLRKGAATNAVQIARYLIEKKWVK
ncbi:MAG TPA: aspartate-semialdehyde dehydrogenase [Bacteroidales bacterium]|jgi:aspartate-semialdehyde dehydrogenase|nr:aspartate-semialdehyde dehydrogenase [Bacteroidales bacterium]